MKKKLTIILLICTLCLAICACNTNTLDKVDQNDSTETYTDNITSKDEQSDSTVIQADDLTSKNEQIDSTETQTNALSNDTFEQPEIEIPLLTLEDDYTEFVNSTELPADFVSYDKIESIGAFRYLVFLSDAYNNDYSWYMYSLVDAAGFDFVLYVDHREEVLSTKDYVSKVNNTNMRLLTDKIKGVYLLDDIEYGYLSGKLNSISWENQNIIYTLCGGPPSLSDYPLTESTFIGKMLNTDTATQALNSVLDEALK